MIAGWTASEVGLSEELENTDCVNALQRRTESTEMKMLLVVPREGKRMREPSSKIIAGSITCVCGVKCLVNREGQTQDLLQRRSPLYRGGEPSPRHLMKGKEKIIFGITELRRTWTHWEGRCSKMP